MTASRNAPAPPALESAVHRPDTAVTVVVRSYNRAERTVRAVASVLDQTRPADRVLVVDDASDDGTPEAVAERFGAAVDIVRRPVNGGPGAAANTALEAVETPFVAFLDSDDTWHPLFLERMVPELAADPGRALVYCDYRRICAGYAIDLPFRCSEPELVESRVSTPIHSMSVVLARTRALRAVGRFREDLRVGEDMDLTIRLALRAPNMLKRVPLSLMHYSFGGDNITGEHERYFADTVRVLDDMLAHPANREKRAERPSLVRRRFLGASHRRAVLRWLAAAPTRTVSLVVISPDGDPAAIRESLAGAAAQRLPPTEAVVLHPGGAAPARQALGDWSFPVRLFARRDDQPLLESLRAVASMCDGALLAPLVAGDRWTPDALDRHRRAFSANIKPVLFSYGGVPARPEPPPLSRDAERCALQAVRHNAPGTLSAMAFARERFVGLTGIPPAGDAEAWLALTLRLLLGDGVAVRITVPILEAGGAPAGPDAATAAAILAALTEIEPGRPFAGLADVAADDAAAGRRVFAAPYDGPEAYEPIW